MFMRSRKRRKERSPRSQRNSGDKILLDDYVETGQKWSLQADSHGLVRQDTLILTYESILTYRPAYFLYMHPVDRTLSDPVRCIFPHQTGILKRKEKGQKAQLLFAETHTPLALAGQALAFEYFSNIRSMDGAHTFSVRVW
ncbi:hypothetical protein TWF225_008854 [Orbilia oligospora]|uniref:Uncharacterized protein n=1 Tax=Orbilia oligospora TaxID=2813651 RepID=A0A7C8PPH5_ORBOL|nr:hypothetical protein TWF751_007624 [Orbilia oligospora]KAF3175744.1 hypothetical protein TWF225_008854 [Orbilia oligospora]KAF3243074.1 hypothetical protein TWF128_010299 [Orbilia oligospora]KAF3246055.1 hypothetical protein TWF217_010035 [Orbilia oligospora]KAF3284379.1 hypothetical protein TWF132_009808 [Orbilia oligospora]